MAVWNAQKNRFEVPAPWALNVTSILCPENLVWEFQLGTNAGNNVFRVLGVWGDGKDAELLAWIAGSHAIQKKKMYLLKCHGNCRFNLMRNLLVIYFSLLVSPRPHFYPFRSSRYLEFEGMFTGFLLANSIFFVSLLYLFVYE